MGFMRRVLTPLDALALTSLLVPFCLTGLLLPWHFIIPLSLLLINGRSVAVWAVLFFTLLVLRSATTVMELLVIAGMFAVGSWIVSEAYRRLSNPPEIVAALVHLLR